LDLVVIWILKETRAKTKMTKRIKQPGFFKTHINFIDRLGGLPLKEITEFCGPAGSGKTKLLHQLTVSYLISVNDSKAYYYDVDNTFDSDYIVRICNRLNYNPDNILDRILIQQFTDISALNRSLNYILKRIKNTNCLLVIDSIPNLFVNELLYESEDTWPSEQLKLIVLLGETLRKVSRYCTILISNHVRSEIISEKKLKESQLIQTSDFNIIPALGSIWEEFIDNRFLIMKIKRETRLMLIYFSSNIPETFSLVKFQNELFM